MRDEIVSTEQPGLTGSNESQEKAVVEASKQPEVKKILANSGADVMFATPEEFGKLVRDDVVKWKKVVDYAGVKME